VRRTRIERLEPRSVRVLLVDTPVGEVLQHPGARHVVVLG
jgi:hypothetical protein